jgi:CDP-diacylglycerol--inositol 3-phosphatidyltransferase
LSASSSQLSRGVESHKSIKTEQGWILRLYYTNRLVLGFLCGFNEGFFLMSYLNYHWTGPQIALGAWTAAVGLPSSVALVPLLIAVATPGMVVKQAINFVQFKQACVDIVNEIDEPHRVASKSTKGR